MIFCNVCSYNIILKCGHLMYHGHQGFYGTTRWISTARDIHTEVQQTLPWDYSTENRRLLRQNGVEFTVMCPHKISLWHMFLCSGIRIQSFKKGQITMDMDFRWGGDPNIILAVETLVASLPIQVYRLLHNLAKAIWSLISRIF